MDAGPMIDRCFRRQNPDAFGRERPLAPELPPEVRLQESPRSGGEYVSEERSGDPNARHLPQSEWDPQ